MVLVDPDHWTYDCRDYFSGRAAPVLYSQSLQSGKVHPICIIFRTAEDDADRVMYVVALSIVDRHHGPESGESRRRPASQKEGNCSGGGVARSSTTSAGSKKPRGPGTWSFFPSCLNSDWLYSFRASLSPNLGQVIIFLGNISSFFFDLIPIFGVNLVYLVVPHLKFVHQNLPKHRDKHLVHSLVPPTSISFCWVGPILTFLFQFSPSLFLQICFESRVFIENW